MTLNLSELETLLIFLRDRHELWRASCAQMGTDPERIALALVREHARLVRRAK